MKRGATTTLLVLLMACGTAQAADWVSIAKANGGKQEFAVDVSTILASGDIRRAWVKSTFAPRTMRAPHSWTKWWAYNLAREAFNCAEETYSKEALTIHYEDGTVLLVTDEPLPTPWIPVAPESVLDAEMKFLCAWKLK